MAPVAVPWIQLLPVGGLALSQKKPHSQAIMNLILTFISQIPLSKHHVKRSLALLHFISSQIILWWCIPKNESRECGGGEGKVPVLTATLMASIWVFGEKHLWILQLKLLSTVCCCLDIITEVFCLFLQSAFHCGGIIGGLHMVLR